jgi:hypothetical protein
LNEGRRKKEEGRRKKKEERNLKNLDSDPTQNEQPVEVGVLNPQLKG